VKSKWVSVPATAFKSEKDLKAKIKGKKRGSKYEEKLVVDLSFEDLIKLSVTDVDKDKHGYVERKKR